MKKIRVYKDAIIEVNDKSDFSITVNSEFVEEIPYSTEAKNKKKNDIIKNKKVKTSP